MYYFNNYIPEHKQILCKHDFIITNINDKTVIDDEKDDNEFVFNCTITKNLECVKCMYLTKQEVNLTIKGNTSEHHEKAIMKLYEFKKTHSKYGKLRDQ